MLSCVNTVPVEIACRSARLQRTLALRSRVLRVSEVNAKTGGRANEPGSKGGRPITRYSYEKFLADLSARIKRMRKERGWTLRDMVVRHDFHLTHWQNFESGKRGFAVPSLLRIAEVFGLRLSELIGDAGELPVELGSQAEIQTSREESDPSTLTGSENVSSKQRRQRSRVLPPPPESLPASTASSPNASLRRSPRRK